MNEKGEKGVGTEEYRSLLILDEIAKDDSLTQRDLSNKLGIALGLINSYLKNLISKGYVTVSGIPRKRYRYYLTPRGFAEKTRLTYRHLQNFTSLYRVARKDFRALFRDMESSHLKRVVFCGVDEVAEIAFLSLSETALRLVAVIDDGKKGKDFFGQTVLGTEALAGLDYDLVVITSFQGGGDVRSRLVEAGVEAARICDISGGGWLARIEKQPLGG